jgi:hypothetical protein
MLFSDAYGIDRIDGDDWFDPLLNADTKLFIDPFLLYDNEEGIFVGSHDEVIHFFNYVLELVAQSSGDPGSANWRQAETLLRLPEVEELCLGYSASAGQGRDVSSLGNSLEGFSKPFGRVL